MWPAILALRSFGPYVLMPVAIVGGTVGYFIESWISDRRTPAINESIEDIRVGRMVEKELLCDPTNVDSLKEKKFVPKSIFEHKQ